MGDMTPDFTKMGAVHSRARAAGVDYSLHYCEGAQLYYFSISSSAPSEEWIGRDHSFNIAVECVCEWLDSVNFNKGK